MATCPARNQTMSSASYSRIGAPYNSGNPSRELRRLNTYAEHTKWIYYWEQNIEPTSASLKKHRSSPICLGLGNQDGVWQAIIPQSLSVRENYMGVRRQWHLVDWLDKLLRSGQMKLN